MQALQKKTLATVADMLAKNEANIAAALPRHITPERISRVALSELRTNPALLSCSPPSLMSAIVKASQLGLEVGSALGHAYLVPYGKEATLIVGYRGLIALARRSGEILSLTARVVYANDVFEIEFGLDEKLRHVPTTDAERGEITHAYAVAKLKDGGTQFDVMTMAEIESVRNRSKAGRSGPWVTDFSEMARKTVVRRLAKYLPISIELAEQLADEERREIDVTESAQVVDLNAQLEAETEGPSYPEVMDAIRSAKDKDTFDAANKLAFEFKGPTEQKYELNVALEEAEKRIGAS